MDFIIVYLCAIIIPVCAVMAAQAYVDLVAAIVAVLPIDLTYHYEFGDIVLLVWVNNACRFTVRLEA